MNLFIDFETRSKVDLKKHGAYRYMADPSTEALCASWALDHGGVKVWRRGPAPEGYDADAAWLQAAADPKVIIVAHNAEFERLALKHLFGLDLPPSRFRCTAAQARRMSLPSSLDLAGQAAGIQHLKDKGTGSRVIQKLCKPRRPSKANSDTFWEEEKAPGDFDDLYTYNEADTEAHRELFYLLPAMDATEQRLWELTVKMNDRGLQVDLDAVRQAKAIAEEETARLAARWEELTGVPAGSPKAAAALGMKSLAKVHVRHMLRGAVNLEPRVREALEIRQRFARSSVRKLATILNMTCADGRYRGGLMYAGAERTARWSGRGVQLQNLPRGLGEKTDLAFDSLALGTLLLGYDDPLRTVSEMLKGMFVGPFLVGDYAQIEARGLAWLAGQNDLVAAFAAGQDVYSAMASAIYGHPVTKSDYDDVLHIAKRQLGKIAVLGCGYGLGPAKFMRQMDEVFDVAVDEETAGNVVASYRAKYPAIPKFWAKLEGLFRCVVQDRAYALRYGKLRAGHRYVGAQPVAYIQLPSGRPLWYFAPEVGPCGFWPSGDPKVGVSYFGRNIYKGGKWERVPTYGGKLTENVVQALSRDAMAEAMLRLDDAGFNLALTVHDEIVSEDPPDALPEFLRIMEQVPAWAEGFPLSVEGYATRRYRK